MQPKGGYKAITVVQLCNVLAARRAGRIGIRAVRVYFAAFVMAAIREAANRTRKGRGEKTTQLVRYRRRELARLTELDEAECARQVRLLDRAGLIRITETDITPTQEPTEEAADLVAAFAGGRSPRRPVPVPRPLLRYLAQQHRAAVMFVLIGYLIRGLTLDQKTAEVRNAGSVKLTWLAGQLGVSERAARYARAELLAEGIITADEGSTQRKLNRTGAYFTVNLDWTDASCREMTEATVAPLALQNAVPFAPPLEDKKTSTELKNQKTRLGRAAAGFCGKREGASHSLTLRNIRPEDIRRITSLRQLFDQAVKAGWVRGGEASFLAFAAAAVRANRAQGDSVRIFVAIVRRGLWSHITQSDEERARAVIARAYEPRPSAASELLKSLAA